MTDASWSRSKHTPSAPSPGAGRRGPVARCSRGDTGQLPEQRLVGGVELSGDEPGDGGQREAPLLEGPDPCQPVEMAVAVPGDPSLTARRVQQALALVVADGIHRYVGLRRQLFDPHLHATHSRSVCSYCRSVRVNGVGDLGIRGGPGPGRGRFRRSSGRPPGRHSWAWSSLRSRASGRGRPGRRRTRPPLRRRRRPSRSLLPTMTGDGEAHLVAAVVDAHRDAVDEEDLAEQYRGQRQGQVAVGDGPAEGAVLGRLGVDVDPLVVARGIGEEVDLCLVDEVPLAVAEMLFRPGP